MIVELTRMRDKDHQTPQGFTLTQPLDVRIYALGEGTPSTAWRTTAG